MSDATPVLPPVAEDVLTQARAYTEDETASEDPQALVAGLLAVIDLIEDARANAQGMYRRSLDARADLEQDNEGLSRHVAFMERYRWRAARLEAAGRRLADAADACTGEGAHLLREPAEELRELLDQVIPEFGGSAFCPDCGTELTPTLLMGCAPCDMKYSPPCEQPQCPLGDRE